MKICEYCNHEHDGNYGTGRFCNSKCSHGFSTKAKRKEINKKVSEKLCKLYDCTCLNCGKKFINKTYIKKTCSQKCRNKYFSKIVTGKQFKSGKDRKKGSGGYREKGGKSIQLNYINHLGHKMKLNKEEIKVAKKLDELKLNWIRNINYFKYITIDGKERKFYPDFYIEDNDLYVEYKGWVTNEMKHKMSDSLKRNNFNLLIIYGNDKRYKNLGLNLNKFEQIHGWQEWDATVSKTVDVNLM